MWSRAFRANSSVAPATKRCLLNSSDALWEVELRLTENALHASTEGSRPGRVELCSAWATDRASLLTNSERWNRDEEKC